MNLAQLEDQFVDIGGSFLSSSFDMKEKLSKIKAYIFDWDGVFNDGSKELAKGSFFSEVDSAGLRMLRYGHYRATGEIPHLAVITGAHNPAALEFMKSQGGNAVYQRAIQKQLALAHFLESHQLQAHEVAYMFDDILDLNVAAQVGLRFCVGRLANPLYLGLVQGSGLADYITACQGNEHAVREVSELLLALHEQYEEVVQELMQRTGHYAEFSQAIRKIELKQFEYRDKEFHLVGA